MASISDIWSMLTGGSSGSPAQTTAQGLQFMPNQGPTQSGAPVNTFTGFNPDGSVASTVPGGVGSVGGAVNGAATPFGMNIGTGQLAMSGLSALGNLWNAYQANNLAKQSFDFTKGMATTNLGNQVQSYNTSLADRANSRAVQENQTPASAQAYIGANQMKTAY
jgi:hypothetical protein